MNRETGNRSRRILVTGGAGFIGSHLVDSLLRDGHAVTLVDNFEYCYADNLESARAHGELRILREDCAADDWRVSGEFDDVYHLAGVVATGDFVARPHSALRVSLWPMERILEYKTRAAHDVRVLFASSSEVYGEPLDHPQREDSFGLVSTTGPRSGYDEGKRAAEALISGWQVQHGLATAASIVRIFNTYGPRMTANGRLVPTMVVDALRNRRIEVNLPGTQTRTLLHVDDCVTALRLAIAQQHPEPINVGGTETMSVAEVAARIAVCLRDEFGMEIEVRDGPNIPHDVTRRRPEISKARDILGWSPTISFEHGLRDVVAYWQPRVAESA